MHEIAKHEFLTWVDTLETDKLSEYEIKMLSILINDFEEIASAGTAAGRRAKLLGKKISELNGQVIKSLPHYKIVNVVEKDIERIESLDVERFRGFGVGQNFTFEKQYTFFHGPNGSGKTSFCEALEYCMLGSIEEASARNIPTEKYIIHAGEKRVNNPVLKCKYSSGEVKECIPNYTRYRFGFVEKNRIDGFSHMSATSAKTQTERMAALFGLSEFQDYVKNFTSAESLGTDKYIKVSASAQNEYEKAVDAMKPLEKQLKEAEETLKTEKTLMFSLIEKLGNPDVTTVEDVEKFFTDSKDGVITKYTLEAEKNKWIVLEKGALENLEKNIIPFIGYFDEVKKSNTEILSDISAVNLVDLFNAVAKLDAENYDRCPVCLTPFNETKVNPFENSKSELEKLKKIELAKKSTKDNVKKIIENYERVFKEIATIKHANLLGDVNYSLFEKTTLQSVDVECLSSNVELIFDELKKIVDKLDTCNKFEMEKEYNIRAIEHNKEYDTKLAAVQKTYKEIVEKNSSVNEKQKNYEALIYTVSEAKKNVERLAKIAETENKEVSFNKKMIEAYGSIIEKLSAYVSSLPAIMARNLSDKVREYYNYINDGDADFELIKEIRLPLAANEKITIEMEDGVRQDALHILSEGHVKILGLSILLAKAISEGITFLIFDDIVNSVDDDHRDGVARLLMTHTDFSNMQMILTCHGEIFVSMLEEYVSSSNLMTRYMFLPADTLDERGVFIKYQDPSIPLEVAKKKFEDNQLKDSAMSCRRAVECITSKLWKKLSPSIGGISVKLRGLQGQPDLYSVTSALYEHTKGKYVQGAEMINEDLKKMMEASSWAKLNKGTHEDKNVPEFSRGEIKQLIELVEKLSKDVNGIKFKTVAI